MTAKILKIVNSAFFGLRRTISSAHEAVTYLGIDTVKALVLVNAIFERARIPWLPGSSAWTTSGGTPWPRPPRPRPSPGPRAPAGTRPRKSSWAGSWRMWASWCWPANFPEAYDRAIRCSWRTTGGR